MLSSYIASLKKESAITPIIIDKNGAISILSDYYGQEIISLDEIKTGDFPGIFMYGIPEEKQHLDMATIRKCIADMNLEPYSGKSVAVLRDFHTATLDAQNAMLKLLEDCPGYVAIILVVDDIESVLDTVRSRVVSFYYYRDDFFLDSGIKNKINQFFSGNTDEFVAYLFDAKYTKDEAIAILRYASPFSTNTKRYLLAIESIFSTNENPRNILESIFLIPDRV